jgi:PAS domain S-box-containing protein
VAAFIDITDLKLANDALARSEARLRRLVDSGLIGVVFGDEYGGLHDANDAFLDVVGYSRSDLEAGLLRWDVLTPPEWIPHDRRAIEEARLRGTCTPYEKEYIHRDGHRVPILVGFTRLTDTALDIVAFILDLTSRKRMELALAESHRTLQALMEYVPVGLFITEGASSKLRYASTQGREMVGLPEDQAQPLREARVAEGWRVLSADGTTPVPDEELPLTRAALRGETLSGQELVVERSDGGRVNVIASARPIRDEAGRVVAGIASWQDVGPLKEAQRRLEAALRRERFVTDLLQRALLPGRMASFQGYEASAAYVPANDEHLVGGDLYDLFPAANGQIGIVLGDVSGKGVEATALAAATRSTLRAFLCEDPSPGTAMTRGNAVLCPQFAQTEAFVTVFLGALDPATGKLRYASAGHCPAFLQRPQGGITLTEPLDVMLGALPETAFREAEVRLEPGDRLVLYTDGLEDARRGAELFGPEGITAALSTHPGCSADDCVRMLLGAATDYAAGRLSDDTAVLVLQRDPVPPPSAY